MTHTTHDGARLTADIPALRQLIAEATPTPWTWRGNTDTGDVRLDGTGRGGAVFDVEGVERTADDPQARALASYLRDCGMPEDDIAGRIESDYLHDANGDPLEDKLRRLAELTRETAIA